MVFVLDNYDSFTYNLVQYLGELGEEVVVRRNDQVSIGEIEAMHPARIVLLDDKNAAANGTFSRWRAAKRLRSALGTPFATVSI